MGGGACFYFLQLGTHFTRWVEGRVGVKASLQVLCSFVLKILERLKNQRLVALLRKLRSHSAPIISIFLFFLIDEHVLIVHTNRLNVKFPYMHKACSVQIQALFIHLHHQVHVLPDSWRYWPRRSHLHWIFRGPFWARP